MGFSFEMNDKNDAQLKVPKQAFLLSLDQKSAQRFHNSLPE